MRFLTHLPTSCSETMRLLLTGLIWTVSAIVVFVVILDEGADGYGRRASVVEGMLQRPTHIHLGHRRLHKRLEYYSNFRTDTRTN